MKKLSVKDYIDIIRDIVFISRFFECKEKNGTRKISEKNNFLASFFWVVLFIASINVAICLSNGRRKRFSNYLFIGNSYYSYLCRFCFNNR